MAYKYITENNLYEKQTYMYSVYRGETFIKEYVESRKGCASDEKKGVGDERLVDTISTPVRQDLEKLYEMLQMKEYNDEVVRRVNGYVKSFEVRKRIYSDYDSDWRPVSGAEFEDYESYLLFAECLLHMYQHTKCLKYFSCLLKVDDTLLSVQNRLDHETRRHLECIVERELEFFYGLANENDVVMEMVK